MISNTEVTEFTDIALAITAKVGAAAKEGWLARAWPIVFDALIAARAAGVRSNAAERDD